MQESWRLQKGQERVETSELIQRKITKADWGIKLKERNFCENMS